MLINGSSASLNAFGLRNQHVIVALNGYRTDDFAQYDVVRSLDDGSDMKVIFWNGKSYAEREGEVARRKFGIDMLDFKSE